jgi:hypothetical protein
MFVILNYEGFTNIYLIFFMFIKGETAFKKLLQNYYDLLSIDNYYRECNNNNV